ncbi:hypothetical protein [Thiobacillus denitrificans]|uniref:hypothetical protein n=1 Tax=Thiobacillus denitrificans TaxID=36861 RepID=UPI0012F8E074|nr:hypothetical protein [Thiobacillus denitrificans]
MLTIAGNRKEIEKRKLTEMNPIPSPLDLWDADDFVRPLTTTESILELNGSGIAGVSLA